MLSITETLKAAINTGDEATVKTTGPQLEDAWIPFEDNAKQKYPHLYKKIENYPHTPLTQSLYHHNPLDNGFYSLS